MNEREERREKREERREERGYRRVSTHRCVVSVPGGVCTHTGREVGEGGGHPAGGTAHTGGYGYPFVYICICGNVFIHLCIYVCICGGGWMDVFIHLHMCVCV